MKEPTRVKLRTVSLAWFPALAWMVLIFILSHQQRIEISDQDFVNFLFFKSLHVVEYAILTLLVYHAHKTLYPQSPRRITALRSGVVSFFYAVSDEIHQTFVPTRSGSVRDVGIDLIGITLVYWAVTRTNFYEKTTRIITSSIRSRKPQ